MPDVLHDEEEDNLAGYGLPVGEGDLPCREAKELSEGVEEPDLQQYHDELVANLGSGG